MTSPLLLGVDAGSSRIRALIFTLEGEIVAEGSVTPPLETPHPGWATWMQINSGRLAGRQFVGLCVKLMTPSGFDPLLLLV